MKKFKIFLLVLFSSIFFVGTLCSCSVEAPQGIQGEQGIKGETGNGISSIKKTSSEGLVDTYTIYFTDGTTSTFTVTNGADGEDGQQGIQGIQGEKGEDGHTPVITIQNGYWYIDGVNTNVLAKGIKGETGNGISSIKLTSSEGLVDTYTIYFTDGTTSTFTVTNGADGKDGQQGIQGIQGEKGEDGHTPVITIQNGYWYIDGVNTNVLAEGIKGKTGNGISSIKKTSSEGLVDTYTIYFTDGTTSTFTVTNGTDGKDGQQGIQGIQGEKGEDGHTPVITIQNGYWYIDGVNTNVLAEGIKGETGNGISSIKLTSSAGLVDTYTIYFTDGTTSTFTVTNGADGEEGTSGLSAYEIYCKYHPEYTGTEEEWLEALVNGSLSAKKTYNVEFITYDGSIIYTQKIEDGKKASKPENPIREGYTFTGWIDENNDHWVFNGYSITSDIKLYAVWTPNGYTINLDSNGGDVDVNSINVLYNEPYDLSLINISREGYLFAGWYYNDELVTSGSYLYTSNVTYIAKWNPLFTIHFDTDGGNEISDYEGHNYTINLLPIPEKDNNQFLGWCYNDELIVTPYEYTFEENEVTFIAKWLTEYTVIELDSNTVEIVAYNGDKTSIVIPETINNKTVTRIGEKAFFNLSTITNVTIPASITEIGSFAFYGCLNLTNVYYNGTLEEWCNIKFNDENSNPMNYASHFYMFNENDDWYEVTQLEIPNTITAISEYQFYGFNDLTNVIIPISVTNIAEQAFWGCGLVNVEIPSSVTSIGGSAFTGCHNLVNVIITSNIASLDWYTFDDCYNLTSIVLPSSVTTIGEAVFAGCRSLINVYYTGISEEWSVINITDPTGNSCLTSATIYYYTETEPTKEGYYWHYVDGVPTIWPEYIPFTYVEYDDYILITGYKGTDTDIVIPETINNKTVTRISSYAFKDQSTLTSVVVPSSVTHIEHSVFSGCSSLKSITLPYVGYDYHLGGSKDTSEPYPLGYIFGDDSYTGGIETMQYVGNESWNYFYIPATLKEVTVTGDISSYGFDNCSNITNIFISENVTTIGHDAFNGCGNLTYNEYQNGLYLGNSTNPYRALVGVKNKSVTTFELNSNVKIIYDFSLSGCANLTYNEYQNGLYLGDSINPYLVLVDIKDTSLTSFDFNSNVKFICSSTFLDCTNLIDISIPKSVISIGSYSFAGCSSLTSIEIPNSVVNIGDGVFASCYSLENIIFEEDSQLTKILEYTFSDCSGLKNIVIPDGIVNIYYRAFDRCDAENLIIPESVIGLGILVFNTVTNIYYEGTFDEWSNVYLHYDYAYTNTPTIYYYSETEPTESGNYWHYDADGVTPVVW